ncbi:MAG: hypothetical protein FJ344_06050 [Sphingomonadales bacterium]|nr:hypothetical protein [Sphingomonadales bacterium]
MHNLSLHHSNNQLVFIFPTNAQPDPPRADTLCSFTSSGSSGSLGDFGYRAVTGSWFRDSAPQTYLFEWVVPRAGCG